MSVFTPTDRSMAVDPLDNEISRNWSEATLGELCNHIVSKYHGWLKQELPRIGLLLYRVAEGDGERHPELHRLLEIYSLFAGDMKLHMEKEECVLFPLIKELEIREGPVDDIGGVLMHPLELSEWEHEQTGRALDEMRQLTRDYSPPSDACETYRNVLSALGDLEKNVHEHAGIENNILFPRACQMQFQEVI